MKIWIHFFVVLLITVSINPLLFAQSGRIAGKVIDQQNKEGIPFVNVIIEGTTLGAATDLDGYYSIINVSPGNYNIRASAIGYNSLTFQNIRAATGLTTTVDFELNEITLQFKEDIVVTATRPMIQKDITASTAIVGSDLISELPVTEIADVLQLQAGMTVSSGGDLHLRGGRKGQIAFQIDGVPVTDAYDGSTVIDVGTNAIQELQVISGAFNAEYGQAMSGVVNIVTKDGNNSFSGNVQSFSGDFISSKSDVFWNIDKIDPIAIKSVEGSFSGPIIKDKLFFFTNARYYYNKGHLFGRRTFLVTDLSREVSGSAGSEFDITQSGDDSFVPMNWNERFFGQGKLTYRFLPNLRFAFSYIYDGQNYQNYDHGNRLTPDNNLKRFRKGQSNTFSVNHALSSTSFYNLNLSYFYKDYRHYLFEDIYTGNPDRPTLYVDNELKQDPPFSYSIGGTNTSRFTRNTGTYSVKLDWTTQLSQEIALQFGGEAKQHQIYFHDINLIPMTDENGNRVSPYNVTIPPLTTFGHDEYLRKPQEASAYLQSKFEAFNLIFNLGVRFDIFNPDGIILSDPTDPNIYNPLIPSNQFNDLNGNGVFEPELGETIKTVEDREKYWYNEASIKYQISPRVGLAFPITDKGVIHFSYGHFFQLPGYEYLYTNPGFKLGVGSGNQGLFGNADLEPQKTIKGEIGLQQQIGDDIGIDVTMFFEDFRNLIGTQTEEILVFGRDRSYSKYSNSDFGFSKGIVVRFEKRFSGGLAANLDYTYSITKGNASNPADARNAVLGGAAPETFIAPLDWNQTHTLNIIIAFTQPRDYGFSVIGNFYSGQPYTPQVNKNTRVAQNAFPRNSDIKPSIFNIDLRAYKDIPIGNTTLTFFLRVFNLLDMDNPRTVFGDTGDPLFTFSQLEAEKVVQRLYYIDTLDDLFRNPGFFSEPRRIEFGASFNF